MPNPITPDKSQFDCHERRHMSGAVYKTYDAIRAMAEHAWKGKQRPSDEPLVCYASVKPTLVNHTNTSKKQIALHMSSLVRDGWLHKCEAPQGKRERNEKGHLMPVVYVVLTHEEYISCYPDKKCPPFKFKEDGKMEKETQQQPIRFQLTEAIKHPAGRAALFVARAAGQLPGKTWDEIVANLEKHPENMPKKVNKRHARKKGYPCVEKVSALRGNPRR